MEVLVFLVQFLHRVNKLPFPVLQMQDLALTYFKIPHPAEEGNPPPPFISPCCYVTQPAPMAARVSNSKTGQVLYLYH